MKIFTKKSKFHLGTISLSASFFLISGFVFYLYSIDFSPLILALLLFVYAKFFRKIENLPFYIDLLLLISIGVIIAFLTTVTFRQSGYAIPAIGFIMLVTFLFDNLELSLLFSIFISYLSASMQGGSFDVGISLFCASLSTALLSYRLRRRLQIIRAGAIAGFIQFFIAFTIENSQAGFSISSLNLDLLRICLINGVVSSIVVIGILPIFEFIFKVVTNISLLELSDFNHPLLRRMILEAPGTYQHSLVVANLAEAAAEAIGANSLLARVGAYYHDIGKVIKPHYFVENQTPYRDVHKRLKPSISKLIIINHVREGVELAKKYHLNPRIIDFIQQHHGRTLVYYFYQRAKELEPDKEHKEEYRYPGPRPQSKEVAIVALADTVEALSRTLEEPTPSRVEEMVREVIRKKFMEGELDESSLTLRDLERITQSFIRILNAIFHTRVNYPKDENSNKKSPNQKES